MCDCTLTLCARVSVWRVRRHLSRTSVDLSTSSSRYLEEKADHETARSSPTPSWRSRHEHRLWHEHRLRHKHRLRHDDAFEPELLVALHAAFVLKTCASWPGDADILYGLCKLADESRHIVASRAWPTARAVRSRCLRHCAARAKSCMCMCMCVVCCRVQAPADRCRVQAPAGLSCRPTDLCHVATDDMA